MALGKLNRLELLAELFGAVQIPRTVYDEVVTQGLVRGAPDALEVPPEILAAYSPPVVLGSGETHVLALAQTFDDPLVLLDDEVARAEARRLNLRVRGTLGVLVQAYRHQLLMLAQVEILILEIAARPDIWLSARLCEQVLEGLKNEGTIEQS
jgi:predicted nucleic acid-binding protein